MSTLALHCCPNCRRNVPPNALVCRACYTVLPRKKKKEELVPATSPRRLLAGPCWIAALVVMAAGVWWARVDLGLVRPFDPQQSERLGSASSLFSLGGGSNAISAPGRTASHWSVLKQNGNCIVIQRLRNVGVAAATRASFQVQFHDQDGNALGGAADIQKRTALGPGQEGVVELVAGCPRSTVGAEVVIVESLDPGSQAKLELLSNPLAASRSVSSESLSTIELEVGDLSICRPPRRCELKISFGEGRDANYWFQRNRDRPEILVNDNSIVIGHLQAKKPATLHLDEELNGTTISLSYKNVHQHEPPGFLERLLNRMPWRSGDDG
jgi:hypothetical protein